MNKAEIWKDVIGYEGLYQVSSFGNVRNAKGKALRFHVTEKHASVWLYKDGVKKKKFIHRLVADAFLENCNKFDVVNHKDENGLNNHIENLEWCDAKYNTNYGSCIKRRADKCKKNICQFDLSGILIKKWHGIVEASTTLRIDPSSITKVAKGKRKSAGGFVWRY